MMRAAGRDTDFVFDDEDSLIGAFLAPDFCGEHESGITRLQQLFGIDRKPGDLGVESRRAIAVEGSNILFLKRTTKGVTSSLLCAGSEVSMRYFKENCLGKPKKSIKKAAAYLGGRGRGDKLSGSWCGDGFSLYTTTAELSSHLEALYTAFIGGDGIIMYGGSQSPFRSPGLALGIISKLSESTKDNMYASDKNSHDLKAAAKATGIYDIVGRRSYFALSPHWCKDSKESKDSNHPVYFLLNPTNQEDNAWGYYTVEELTAWIKGEAPDGPIAGRGNRWQRRERAKKVAAGDMKQLFSDEVCCTPCLSIINVGRGGMSRRSASCSKCGNKELVKPTPIGDYNG
jgi:hypothetical protein